MLELQSLCDRVLSDDNVRSCPHGRPTTVRLTKYELDKTGNVIKIITPAGYIIKRAYDKADKLIEEVHIDKENGIENKTVFTYDKAGNIIKVIDTNGAEEIYEYDLLNRETRKINKDGGVERSFYLSLIHI